MTKTILGNGGCECGWTCTSRGITELNVIKLISNAILGLTNLNWQPSNYFPIFHFHYPNNFDFFPFFPPFFLEFVVSFLWKYFFSIFHVFWWKWYKEGKKEWRKFLRRKGRGQDWRKIIVKDCLKMGMMILLNLI